MRLAIGYAKNLVVDLAYVLEGKTEPELPESVMATVRIKNIDMVADATHLPPRPPQSAAPQS